MVSGDGPGTRVEGRGATDSPWRARGWGLLLLVGPQLADAVAAAEHAEKQAVYHRETARQKTDDLIYHTAMQQTHELLKICNKKLNIS